MSEFTDFMLEWIEAQKALEAATEARRTAGVEYGKAEDAVRNAACRVASGLGPGVPSRAMVYEGKAYIADWIQYVNGPNVQIRAIEIDQ